MATTGLSELAAERVTGERGRAVGFSKYTSFGNTFLIVDESDDPQPDDAQRARFARWALNQDFGIGGTDNVLYLRAAGQDERSADGEPADVVFRIFEYDGSETLSCGNGLLSTAAYLGRRTGGGEWRILTELPSGRPKLVRVGIGERPDRTWVEIGWARPAPAGLYRRARPAQAAIDQVPPLPVPLPAEAEWAAGLPEHVTLSGLLTYTGEPHLVLFEGHGFPAELAASIWVDPAAGAAGWGLADTPEMAASRRLVHHLGSEVNRRYRHLFPQGVHLNFARIRSDAVVEYRTWERAIDCETLACGSGTVAMAHVARTHGLMAGTAFTFWPHRCRWYRREASLGVAETDRGYRLTGSPELVCEGVAANVAAEEV